MPKNDLSCPMCGSSVGVISEKEATFTIHRVKCSRVICGYYFKTNTVSGKNEELQKALLNKAEFISSIRGSLA